MDTSDPPEIYHQAVRHLRTQLQLLKHTYPSNSKARGLIIIKHLIDSNLPIELTLNLIKIVITDLNIPSDTWMPEY